MALSKAGYVITGETAIYGMGDTPELAWEDAEEWCSWAACGPDWARGLECWPATAALIAEVKDRGGAIAWGTVGTIACTVVEMEP